MNNTPLTTIYRFKKFSHFRLLEGTLISKHLLTKLRETPFLIGWLIIGAGVAFIVRGWTGLLLSAINLILLGFYAVLIRWLTPQPPRAVPVRRPKLETGVALIILLFFLVIQLFHFGVWTAQPWYGWIKNFFAEIYNALLASGKIPQWALQDVFLAISSTIKQLLPTMLVLLMLGYRRSGSRLSGSGWRLAAVLTGITTFFGLITGMLFQAPPQQIAGLWLIGIFINAFPEELFFRGSLLPRLEKLFNNPLNALVVSAILFNALHLPIEIYHGVPLLKALLGIFSTAYPTGLIWGYLYLRTRSILPGTLWHASNTHLGFIFMDF